MTNKQIVVLMLAFVSMFVFALAIGHNTGHKAGYDDGILHMQRSLSERHNPPLEDPALRLHRPGHAYDPSWLDSPDPQQRNFHDVLRDTGACTRITTNEETDVMCANAIDDDCDGLVDSQDPGCGPVTASATETITVDITLSEHSRFTGLVGNNGELMSVNCNQTGTHVHCTNVPAHTPFLVRAIQRY